MGAAAMVRKVGGWVLSAVLAVVGIALMLFLLGLTIQVWNGIDSLAQSDGDHTKKWWAWRVIAGLLGAVLLTTLKDIIASVVTAVVNAPAWWFGSLFGRLLGRRSRPRLDVVGWQAVNLGKIFFGFFGALAFYWYVILAPLWSGIPAWSLRVAMLGLLIVWMPGVMLLGFASAAPAAVVSEEEF